MKYYRLLAVFPAVALATRPAFETFQPGEGYLDNADDSDFSYVDGNNEELLLREKRQVMYQQMPNNAVVQPNLGMPNFGTTIVGNDNDSEHMYNTGANLAQWNANNAVGASASVDASQVSDISGSLGSTDEEHSDEPQQIESKEDSAQMLLQLETAIADTITELEEDSEITDTERRQINHLQSALNWLAETSGTTYEDILARMEQNNENISAQVVQTVINRQKTMFKSSNKRNKQTCRKGTQLNSAGKCEAVLPLNLNYGCWCHADNTDIFKGKGQHVDEFDKACKMYKQCLRCVKHDARNDGEVCDPGTVAYSTEGHRSTEGIHLECSRANDNNCAVNTCCCEVEYVRSVLRLFVFEGVKLQNKFYHSKFDHEEKCEGKVGNGHSNECCGVYPHRRMYNTQGKQCCNNISVFDPYTHVCCDDGNTAPTAKECDSPVRKRKRRSVRNLFDGKKKAKK